MGERSGYTTHLYILDCSPSMADLVPDPTSDKVKPDKIEDKEMTQSQYGGGVGPRRRDVQVASKLKWAKEYINRKIVAAIATKRKTEHVCVITVGDGTNNSAGEGYEFIDVLFPPTTAEDSMVDKVLDVDVGENSGDVFGALTVGLDLLAKQVVWSRPAWAYELHIITDGVSDFGDELLESLKNKLPSVPASTTVVGFGFADKLWEREGGNVEQDKSEVKLANEANLSSLRKHLKKPLSDSSNPPRSFKIASASRALLAARFPAPKITKPTNKSFLLRLGGGEEEDESGKGIEISVKWAKMTSVVQPPSLKKLAVKFGVGGDGRSREAELESERELQSQHLEHYNRQHQSSQFQPQSQPSQAGSSSLRSTQPPPLISIPSVVSGPLERVTKYKLVPAPSSSSTLSTTDLMTAAPPGQEVLIEKEKLTRAYKLGSSWVPVEEEDELTGGKAGMSIAGRFETKKGLDVYSFLYASKFNRSFSLSEIYAIFPEPNSSRAQIEFSSLVQAMLKHPKGEMHILMRLVTEDGLPPKLCIGKAIEEDGVGREYMVITKMPFADDYTDAVFPSLENVKSRSGKPIDKHINLPTSDQQTAMDAFVSALDLSNAREDPETSSLLPWYTPEDSYKPGIHRMKDAIYYQMTGDVEAGDRIPDPHPELLRYLVPPRDVVERAREEGVVQALRRAMNIKKVPARKVKRKNAEAGDRGVEDHGDIDDILNGQTITTTSSATALPPSFSSQTSQRPTTSSATAPPPSKKAKTGTATFAVPWETTMMPEFDADKTIEDSGGGDGSGSETEDEGDDDVREPKDVDMVDEEEGGAYHGEDPKAVFERSLGRKGEGDQLPGAMDKLERTILGLVDLGPLSHSQALDCILYLRQQCIVYEETLHFNSFLKSLKTHITSTRVTFAKAFWKRFVSEGGLRAGLIRLEEDEFRESRVTDAEAMQFLR